MLTVWLILAVAARGATGDDNWQFQQNFGTDLPADWIAYTGRGAIYFAFSDFVESKVEIYTTYYNNRTYLGKLAVLYDGRKGFGNTIDMHGTHNTGPMLFVTQRDGDTGVGSAYVFSGEWNKWTQIQQLLPPDRFLSHSDFGSSISVDKASLLTAVVGCPRCNDTEHAGQVYVYSATSPSARVWTNTQVLTAQYYDFEEDPLKVTYFLGDSVLVSGGVILGRGLKFNGRTGLQAVVAFTRDPVNKIWSQQQVIYGASDAENFDVHGHTIVVGMPGLEVRGMIGAGAVEILYPNTKEYGTASASRIDVQNHPLHPRGMQWSSRQVLTEDDPTAHGNFGSDLSLYEDQLIVGEQGASRIHVFARPSISSHWSQRQIISPSIPMNFFSDNYLNGANLVTVGFPIREDNTFVPSVELYSEDTAWECLVVTLEDAFGDGWSSARLQVETPSGDLDYFSSYCNYPNPFTFRYCPLFAKDGGTYTFSVPDALKKEFYWELRWRVYEERSGQTFIGNYATIMEFYFDTSEVAFVDRSITLPLPEVASCSFCREYTEEEAPGVGDSSSWQYMTMHASPESPWFDPGYKGAGYVLSDTQGRKAIFMGTMCAGEIERNCWLDLPDGTYVLRIAGDLGSSAANHSWSFCGLEKESSSSSHVLFTVENSECTVVAFYSLDTYCHDPLNAFVSLDGESLIVRTEEDLAPLLSAYDRAQFSYAFSDAVMGLGVKDIAVTAVVAGSSAEEIRIKFTLVLDTLGQGYDPRDYDSMLSMTNAIIDGIQQAVDTGDVVRALQSSSMVPESTFFRTSIAASVSYIGMMRINLVQFTSNFEEQYVF
mmetsp:Transcript_2705/g.4066  ORF Transcript_2705/g.4066 Transcript_2705/m.4066 type:complete len:825 (+) Transcript_2705:177-2651(+)